MNYNALNIVFIKTVILVFITVFLYSCDSPTDVQANRIKIENKKNGENIFQLEPLSFDYERLILNREYEAKFSITNLTDKDLTISKILFTHQPQNFRIKDNRIVKLKPSGLDGSSEEISIIIQAKQLGFIGDTLFFDAYYKPFIVVSANVPTVFTSNVDFGESSVRASKYKTIDVYNFGSHSAIIRNFTIEGDSDFFKLENFNPNQSPIIIEPNGGVRQLIVSFTPVKDIHYNAVVSLEIETLNTGIIHNRAELKGLGR